MFTELCKPKIVQLGITQICRCKRTLCIDIIAAHKKKKVKKSGSIIDFAVIKLSPDFAAQPFAAARADWADLYVKTRELTGLTCV